MDEAKSAVITQIVASNHVSSRAATGPEVISTDTQLQNSNASSETSNELLVVQDGDKGN